MHLHLPGKKMNKVLLLIFEQLRQHVASLYCLSALDFKSPALVTNALSFYCMKILWQQGIAFANYVFLRETNP